MASFNITVEDYSPLISYTPTGAWIDTPTNDSLVSEYSGSSFHTTSAQDASATIQFNGTGISLFGGKRSNYGSYKFTVDGQTIEEGSAASSSSLTKQVLGSVSGLADGPHTAVFTYTGGSGSAIDIDSVVLQSQVGSGSMRLTSLNFDDADANIIYEPSSAWNTNSRPEFLNNTLHFTSSPDAKASMRFTGDAVAVYGTVAPDHSDIQVTVDGKSQTLRGGAGGGVRTLRTQTLLYYASNLGLQEHLISLQPVSTENAPFMDLDSITVFSAVQANNNQVGAGSAGNGQSSTGTVSTVAPSSTAGSQAAQKSGSISKKTIIAASIGGAVGFVLLLALLFLFFTWKRRRRSAIRPDDMSPKSPQLPIQRPVTETGFRSPISRWSFQTPFVPQSRVTSVASTYESTAPMLKDVPIIKPPSPARMSDRAASPVRPTGTPYTPGTPSRPPRPPTLDYDYYDGGPGDPARAV